MPLPVILFTIQYSSFIIHHLLLYRILPAPIAPMEAASFCDEQGEEQKIQQTAGGKEMSNGFPKCSLFKAGYNAQVYFGVP
ncbi:hypothetical protein [Chryseobacterium taklimakanense]|uniref:Uncharacterized protein n=1 Tax=Chryseobacterium taklimakanense TaxID=536441 RepID=A0A3G8WXA1_9FLAO|nr:hypothetical protein [Chryseobacterium taklimakanense]AZI20971.1 hypothetical protein EIH08_09910 [Chryseobacterium taklimakanense]